MSILSQNKSAPAMSRTKKQGWVYQNRLRQEEIQKRKAKAEAEAEAARQAEETRQAEEEKADYENKKASLGEAEKTSLTGLATNVYQNTGYADSEENPLERRRKRRNVLYDIASRLGNTASLGA